MNEYEPVTPAPRPRPLFILVAFGVLIAAALSAVLYTNSAPSDFPVGEEITIHKGASLASIAAILDEKRVIRSAFLFRSIIIFFGAQTSLQAGAHQFDRPLSTYTVARSFINQSSRAPLSKVTIPEGSTLADFDAIISGALPHIEKGALTALVKEEGVLFPDTYLWGSDVSVEEMVTAMKENQREKLAPLQGAIAAHALTESEVITLASIVEREANDEESMRMVAGILLERLRIDMPLQVDAPFMYLLGKTSAELTPEDLDMDSPFNTYRYYGLPPSPIGSPGITAIQAVLEPTPSPYLYYLTDSDGNFYYAETFDEHKDHKARYLR